MTETELAWAAGLFEGEGTVRVNTPTPRNRGALLVAISNTDCEVLRFFGERWGGCLKPVSKMRAEHAQGYVWTIAATVAAEFLRQILPYLRTTRNRRRAKLGMRFQRQKSRLHRVNRTPEYIARQQFYYLVFKRLNQQGAGADRHVRAHR